MNSKLINQFYQIIEKKSRSRFFSIRLAAIVFLMTCIFSTPNVFQFFSQPLPPVWQTIQLKAEHPADNLEHLNPYTWQAKKVFRLTIPLLIRYTKIGPTGIMIIQIVVGLLIFVIVYQLTFRISKDPVQATLFTIGTSFIYLGRAAFFEYYFAWFDAFSFFFVLMSMYCRSVPLLFFFSQAALWNDERSILALSGVIFFHIFFERRTEYSLHYFSKLRLNISSSAVVVASLISYIIVRLLLMYRYGMHMPTSGIGGLVVLNKTAPWIPLGLFSFFKGYWLVLLFSSLLMVLKREFILLVIFTTITLLTCISAFFVTDITRSGTFAFVSIFFCLCYLNHIQLQRITRKLIFISVVTSIIVPGYFICPDWPMNQQFYLTNLHFLLSHIH